MPYFREGDPIPPDRDLRVVADDRGSIRAVLYLLLRAWPYIRPQVYGRWWIPGQGIENRVAEAVSGRGYGFGYVPPLVAAVAIGGPYFGYVPASLAYPLNLLYAPILAMTLCAWPVALSTGNVQKAFAFALLLFGVAANVAAAAYVEGAADNWYAGAVTAACVLGWILQFGIDRSAGEARLVCRIRTASHMVYWYAYVALEGFLFLVMGLLVADLLNQSILQADPLMPGRAELFGEPDMSSDVTEQLTGTQRMALIWKVVLIEFAVMMPLFLLAPVVEYYRTWFMQNIEQALRLALADRWRRLSLAYHSDHRTGDSIFRIQVDASEVSGVLALLMGISRGTIQCLFLVVLVTLLSPWLGLTVFASFFPMILLAYWAMRRFRTRNLVMRMANADLTSRIQEAFRAVRLNKAYGVERQSQDRFESDSLIAFNADYRQMRVHTVVGVAMGLIYGSLILAGTVLMALWANAERATFANELIALAGFSFVLWNLTAYRWAQERFSDAATRIPKLVDAWGGAQVMAMGLRRAFEILDMESEVRDRDGAIPLTEFSQEVRFDNVAFAYGDDRPVLRDVSFVARPGMVTAIVGPTGAGKTTLMNLLLRLADPDAGSIRIDGRDLRDYQVDSLRANIAVALQENVLFRLSVRDNIRLRRPGCERRGGGRSHAAGVPGRFPRWVAPGTRHRARRPRRQVVRRPAPAPVDRPRGGSRHADPRAGRADRRARCRDRTPGVVEPRRLERRERGADRRPHGFPDHPPDFDRSPRGQHSLSGRRAHSGKRHPRIPDGHAPGPLSDVRAIRGRVWAARTMPESRLREDERALDERASLADRETDIDYRRTFRIIGRSALFLRYVWLRYVVSFVSHWIPENLAIVLAPWMGKIIIDHVVLGQPVENVTGYPSFLIPAVQALEGASAGLIMSWIALLTLAGLLARLGHRYVMALFDIRIEQSIVHLVRSRLFESVQSLPMTKLDDQPIGDSVYRVMNDTGVIPNIISTVVQQPIYAVATFAVALATLLSAYPDSPAVALFAVGALPMYLLAIAPFARMLRRRAQAMLASMSAFTSNIEEGMDNMLAVQGLGAAETEGERFRRDSAESFRRIRYSDLAQGVVGAILQVASQLLEWGFSIYVVAWVIFGDLSAGDYVVVLGYFAAMREPAQGLAKIWVDVQAEAATARRVFAMLDLPPETETGRLALPPIERGAEFRRAGFVYPGRTARAGGCDVQRPHGADRRHRRAYRRRQDDACAPAAALSRGERRPGPDRRPRRERRDHRKPARTDQLRVPGDADHRRVDFRQHPPGQAPTHPRKRWSGPRGRRAFTTSSRRCPPATTPCWAPRPASCRRDRSSA